MKRMAVHNGIFHADDVFGVALMQSIYNDLEIIIMERFWYIIYKCKIPRSI